MASDKLWLIRTTKKQILGPVSREKVIELIEKGALSDKDEVTKGNGYWFHLREKDLLDKYLYGDIPQEFNPISEAPDILTSQAVKESTGTIDKIPGLEKAKAAPTAIDDETLIPSNDDLEYPDMGGGVSSEDQVLMPEGDDLDYPDMEDISRPDITVVAPAPTAPVTPKAAPVALESTVIMSADGEEVHIPSSDDLEYPDMDMGITPPEPEPIVLEEEEEETLVMETVPEPEEITPIPEPEPTPTPVVSLNRKAPQSVVAKAIARSKPAVEVEEEDDEDEDDEEEDFDSEEDTDPARNVEGLRGKVKREVRIKRTYEAPARNDRYLLVLLALVILILASGIVYYYSRILGKPLPFLSGLLIPSVHAQTTLTQPQNQVETTNLSKKKTSLNKTL